MTSNINETLLKKYANAVKTLEKTNHDHSQKDGRYKGYLINLNDYKNFKKKIQYDKYKNSFVQPGFEIKDKDKLFTLNALEIKSKQHLINLLINGNKYIIVDNTFYKYICEKGKAYIIQTDYSYTNKSQDLNIILKDQTLIKFDNKNKDNIIEKLLLKNPPNTNITEINKVYVNIKKYYDFETKIETQLKTKKDKKIIKVGFLIEKEWIDKWKKNIKYEIIKKDFLTPKKAENEIIDNLIDIFGEKTV